MRLQYGRIFDGPMAVHLPDKVGGNSQGPAGLVVSLDFELHWGVRDHRTVDQYRENLLGARQAVPAMLRLFEHYGIHATWATVGFLFFRNTAELKSAVPDELPHYHQRCLDPYAALPEIGNNEEEDPFHFAPALIRKILASDGQEIATHTLSHFYALAPGPTLDAFRADLRGAMSAARPYGVSLKSIVFPRNQISREHIEICAEEGLIAYRSVEADPFIRKGNGVMGRALRLSDAYFNLSGDGCVTPSLDAGGKIVRVSQSRFLRPWDGTLKAMESMRLKRICESMSAAAKNRQIFHLWWHPHNFGADLDKNMAALTQIAQHYTRLRRESGWASLTMAEVAESLLNRGKPPCVA